MEKKCQKEVFLIKLKEERQKKRERERERKDIT